MDTLYQQLCAYSNLLLAYKKARKHKTLRPEIIEFEKDLEHNLLKLQSELLFHTYTPQPLTTFIIRDPKTRKINKSAFRDRVVHHALCNIIGPLFEKSFVYDSYANRKGKGTIKAVQRFEYFARKVSGNYSQTVFVFKADIRHYFESVRHDILLSTLHRKMSDPRVLWLIQKILCNYGVNNRGMPLGNLTSQFFANVYLHELDHFVKFHLKAKYYLRYVDDFVIIDHSQKILQEYQSSTNLFLKEKLFLELHSDKSKIRPLQEGIEFLGFRIFSHHKLLKQKNMRKFQRTFAFLCTAYDNKEVSYDQIYEFLEGWIAYAKQANTYKLRRVILSSVEQKFSHEIATKEVNNYSCNLP